MTDLSFVLHDLVATMDQQGEDKLRPLGLTMRRCVALTIIGDHPGVTSRRLADALRVTEAAASGIVRLLIGARLVSDEHTPGSGRAKALVLTALGRGTLESAAGVLGGSFDAVARAAGEDPDDLALRLSTILDRMREDG